MSSAASYNIHRKIIDEEDSLFTSFRFASGIFNIKNKSLRSSLADYVTNRDRLQGEALRTDVTCKDIKQYCAKIKNGRLQGGPFELRCLAFLCHIIIYVVHIPMITSDEEIRRNHVYTYGTAFDECIYLIYDEKMDHYDVLSMISSENPQMEQTIFNPNDEMVKSLINNFMQNEILGKLKIYLEKICILFYS